MSMTLGEKLRQAREQKGFTLSEVAEQTRISPLYLESIENDDYGILPGGIFNKGFVKSYAKFVGVNEQEALQDYSNLVAQNEASAAADDPKPYRPQVLTDSGSGRSMVPTAIMAIVMLGLMTGGVLWLLSYRQGSADTGGNTSPKPPPVNANGEAPANANTEPSPVSDVPSMASLKVEFKATTSEISISATSDGNRTSKLIAAGSTETFEPKESLKISYSRSLAQFAQLTINGKQITMPAAPIGKNRSVIEFEVNKDTLPAIWKNGAISTDVPGVIPDANANAALPTTPSTHARPAARPANTAATNANAAANTAPKQPANTKANPTPNTPPANRPANRPPQ